MSFFYIKEDVKWFPTSPHGDLNPQHIRCRWSVLPFELHLVVMRVFPWIERNGERVFMLMAACNLLFGSCSRTPYPIVTRGLNLSCYCCMDNVTLSYFGHWTCLKQVFLFHLVSGRIICVIASMLFALIYLLLMLMYLGPRVCICFFLGEGGYDYSYPMPMVYVLQVFLTYFGYVLHVS